MTDLPAWFCVRTRAKREHIVEAHLTQAGFTESFLPRIRFRRPTRRGPKWFTEALFPCYLFARFDWSKDLRHVLHLPGVSSVVHFGDRWPAISEQTIGGLKELFGPEPVKTVEYVPADREVEVIRGAFSGMRALLMEYYPARERVRVLLEFLGRQTAVELRTSDVVGLEDPRRGAFGPSGDGQMGRSSS